MPPTTSGQLGVPTTAGLQLILLPTTMMFWFGRFPGFFKNIPFAMSFEERKRP
jgi:hypothetical protein